ncbi:NYN domain-containing protein [Labedaea rhizosphaerae]|uniref:Putative RNA-binding protein with PIN domain n=1 Tax=Labedaea rhizosphaerae TaxID=598644 RepID=A0A4R6S8J9_LABRH|nr:NYN domain-containing protein [Labedaea rhizosphaerae]TDP96081.1 putative RNA-binding protein with PIN domain [Labedaea rhizosphaerae]
MAAPSESPGSESPGPAPETSEVDGLAADDELLPESTVDWNGLPDAVRARLADLGAEALGELSRPDVPQNLRPVAKFAPAKRARLGGPAIVGALRDSRVFRTAVVEWVREHHASALDLTSGDAAASAAAAVLLGEENASFYVELVARRAGDAALRAERDAAKSRAEKAEQEAARLRSELDAVAGVSDRILDEREAELDKLRKRLREQGVKLRAARDEAERAVAAVAEVRAEYEDLIAKLIEERDTEHERAETERANAQRAKADMEIARQSAREARQADEVRLSLLVETLDGAVTGLRRELALGGTGPRPADLVRGATAGQGTAGRVDDPAALDRLLALPAVHLVVDGYNVTKTGYPELPLADQRDRLVHQLSSLAARTGAEVTLVFDGAGVIAVPIAAPRGVRVLFSDPGVLADDVIRALVTAEPEGRPVIVVTSDRAVADSVRRRGAHSVPSAVLLARLGRV